MNSDTYLPICKYTLYLVVWLLNLETPQLNYKAFKHLMKIINKSTWTRCTDRLKAICPSGRSSRGIKIVKARDGRANEQDYQGKLFMQTSNTRRIFFRWKAAYQICNNFYKVIGYCVCRTCHQGLYKCHRGVESWAYTFTVCSQHQHHIIGAWSNRWIIRMATNTEILNITHWVSALKWS